ncbi:hypothetical protein MIB92_11015 [Aestuariirhabdus sp. Z084]|uniref:hypothetical protein n=1 Tax=Aestuariirhabdus haliotis TaxID=2918751 RepID=UPI00201B387C|nr:hypothetical protein [Aestuariirhabdus haliotis]MCL6416182.1 hypothetical protein [Aestuariirhabdus haliotis]MCL6420234.1 hypothetical protein [Aestuariirhabdus haliotis]
MNKQVLVFVTTLLFPVLVQAQGYFFGHVYIDEELPQLFVKDQREGMERIKVSLDKVTIYDRDNQQIEVGKLHSGDAISYKYDSYTQQLELWVDFVSDERVGGGLW